MPERSQSLSSELVSINNQSNDNSNVAPVQDSCNWFEIAPSISSKDRRKTNENEKTDSNIVSISNWMESLPKNLMKVMKQADFPKLQLDIAMTNDENEKIKENISKCSKCRNHAFQSLEELNLHFQDHARADARDSKYFKDPNSLTMLPPSLSSPVLSRLMSVGSLSF